MGLDLVGEAGVLRCRVRAMDFKITGEPMDLRFGKNPWTENAEWSLWVLDMGWEPTGLRW